MNKIYNLILTLLICGQVYSQCTVNALSYIWPDTTNINFCFQLGDTLVIDATNNQVATQLDNDLLCWLEREFNFRIEKFPGHAQVNPMGTVLLSFEKQNSNYDIFLY